ncbi:MAG: SHOCT domain-containing protein [Chitinivibrionales bacterium]|nr:SHOCT domain-containing protein [Chitinivibrionales bacterium]MBD3356560.1 SHOCT domain-containing protein [Chitinivibrionales bacterium]
MRGGRWGHMMDRWHMTGWEGWLLIFFWLALLAVLIFILVRGNAGRWPGSSQASPTALDILKKRYANGEISKHELEEKRKDIAH